MSGFTDFIKTRPIVSAALGIAVLAAGASAVSAQYGQGGWQRGGPGGWDRGGPSMGMSRGARFERFCANETARYQPVARAFVKADLRLSGAQSTEFDKLADVLMPAMEALKAEACNNFATRTAPPPEKLEKLAAMLRKAADAAEQSVGPAKTFYAQLDDKQKARIDEVMERRRGGFRHGGMGPGGPGGPGAPR